MAPGRGGGIAYQPGVSPTELQGLPLGGWCQDFTLFVSLTVIFPKG